MFIEKGKHNINNFFPQICESLKFLHLYFIYYASKLFVNKLHTLQTGGFKPIDLLLAQIFKSDFWNVKIWSQTASISYSSFYIIICKCIERVDTRYCCCVYFIKNIVQSASTLKFRGSVFNKTSFKEFRVCCGIFSDNV